MPQYTGKQSVLTAALGKFAELGFDLREPDDHFTELYFKGKNIAVYNQHVLTLGQLETDCQNYLDNIAYHGTINEFWKAIKWSNQNPDGSVTISAERVKSIDNRCGGNFDR